MAGTRSAWREQRCGRGRWRRETGRGGSPQTRPGPRICGDRRRGPDSLHWTVVTAGSVAAPTAELSRGRPAVSSGSGFSWAILPLGGRCGRLRRSVPPDYVMGERERRAIRCRHPLCGVRAEKGAARASTHPGQAPPRSPPAGPASSSATFAPSPQRVASAVDDGSVTQAYHRQLLGHDPDHILHKINGSKQKVNRQHRMESTVQSVVKLELKE